MDMETCNLSNLPHRQPAPAIPGPRGYNGILWGTTGYNGIQRSRSLYNSTDGARRQRACSSVLERREALSPQGDASCATLRRPLCRRRTSNRQSILLWSQTSTSRSSPDDCFLLPTTTTTVTTTTHSLHTLFTTHSDRLVMATATYPQDNQDHSYPPLPPPSHDMNRSETNVSSTSSFAKNRYPPDDDNEDDNDVEPSPFPKEAASQWDQPPPPLEQQRPARKWWQVVRSHTTSLSYLSPFSPLRAHPPLGRSFPSRFPLDSSSPPSS